MVSELISKFNLLPHPEGGYFAETYRSPNQFDNNQNGDFPSKRNWSTAIYFLLVKDSFSAFHKIKSDEVWHFYFGSPIEVIVITPTGELKKTVLGTNFNQGEVFQYTVSAGNWFGSRVKQPGEFGFVGCTVAPGFSFEDFEMPTRHDLLQQFPQHKQIILELTR